jgi:hypothetical protein
MDANATRPLAHYQRSIAPRRRVTPTRRAHRQLHLTRRRQPDGTTLVVENHIEPTQPCIADRAPRHETLMMSDDGTRFVANAARNTVAKVYTLVGGAWTQTGATIVAPAGVSVRSEGLALSRDGKTAAVGYVNGTPRRVRVFSITP